jgi:2-polyprenyl-6-methoxyphenol hydroxylase-like FAD-dependent oxidoreductase
LIMTTIGKQALVIGSSMAGMLAARTLADFFEQVTILERDRLPDGPENRGGVPQARHLHLLLSEGFSIMEAMFPGFNEELAAKGVPEIHWCWDSVSLTAGGWLPRFKSDVITRVPTRVLLDWTIRQRLMANPRIHFLEERQVIGLTATPEQEKITGLKVKKRGSEEEEVLLADLVVDASGRESHAPEWLQAFGYEAPPETHVNAFLGYATRWYEGVNKPTIDWHMALVTSKPPDIPRGGVMLEVEGGRWIVTLVGINKDYPPTDEDGFLEFARSLVSPIIYDAIKDATPISSIAGYQRTANRRRHFERLSRLPGGFIVLGDAACAFNPVYGQGMTLAAIGAKALGECLSLDSDLMTLPPRFQKRLAGVLNNAWLMATGEDLRYPGTEGKRPNAFIRLTQKYLDRVQQAMPYDNDLTLAFIKVMNLRMPPTSLFHPKIMWKVLRAGRSSAGGQALKPLPSAR